MRWVLALAGAGLVAGCATQRPPPRVVVHRPTHPASAATKPSTAASTPVKLDAPTPAPEGPGANVPLEGFRPLRGQAKTGA
jgi:hypothetical protein